jgi:hypothetical protein
LKTHKQTQTNIKYALTGTESCYWKLTNKHQICFNMNRKLLLKTHKQTSDMP